MSKLFTINNRICTASNIALYLSEQYNPLNLPPNTVRVRTSDGNAPFVGSYTRYETATLVTGTTDVYDVYKSGTSFSHLLSGSTNVVEVLGANTTGIRYMDSMFDMCASLTTVPLFDTSSVTDMFRMFGNCMSLTAVPLFDTSNVTNMSSMFGVCTSLTTVPLFNTSSVTNMREMFGGCSSLTSVPLFDTYNVTNMCMMFYGCTSLATVPLFYTSNVTDMSYMFGGCYSFTTIPLFDTSRASNMDYMFWQCGYVQTGALALYQQASSQANPPTKHSLTFYNCGANTITGAAELAQIPSGWK